MNSATVTRNEGSGARRGSPLLDGHSRWAPLQFPDLMSGSFTEAELRVFVTNLHGRLRPLQRDQNTPGWPAYLPVAGITRPEKAAPSVSATLTRLSLVPSVSLLQILPINRNTATLRSIKRSDGVLPNKARLYANRIRSNSSHSDDLFQTPQTNNVSGGLMSPEGACGQAEVVTVNVPANY